MYTVVDSFVPENVKVKFLVFAMQFSLFPKQFFWRFGIQVGLVKNENIGAERTKLFVVCRVESLFW